MPVLLMRSLVVVVTASLLLLVGLGMLTALDLIRSSEGNQVIIRQILALLFG